MADSTKVGEAIGAVALDVGRDIVHHLHGQDVEPVLLAGGSVSIGISIGLRTAIADIAGARALLHAIEEGIELNSAEAWEDRDAMAQRLQALVR